VALRRSTGPPALDAAAVSGPVAQTPPNDASGEKPPPRAGELVEYDAEVTPPVRVSGGPAVYPDAARRLGLLGSVTVAFVVSEQGLPEQIRVMRSAGAILDGATLEALRSWRFEPARLRGVKVSVRWRVRQVFRR
jgi:protein TonB